MTEQFIDFMTNPGPVTFQTARAAVMADPAYDPYSDDLKMLDDLFVNEKYQSIAAYKHVNILLSPLAHLIKSVAYEKLDLHEEAQSEMYMWRTIVKAIEATGDGSRDNPYLVTRVSDERDLIEYMNETFTSQSLVHEGDKHLDCLSLASGKEIWFDITGCLRHIAVNMDQVAPPVAAATSQEPAIPEEVVPEPTPQPEPTIVLQDEEDFIAEEEEVSVAKRKWWKFW